MDAEEEAHWVAPAAAGVRGCTVLLEADPPPGTAIGHMSFQAFNPAVEKLHVRPPPLPGPCVVDAVQAHADGRGMCVPVPERAQLT